MSNENIDDFNTDAETSKKKKINFEKFLQQFNTLDPNNMGSWPISVKATCCAFVFLLVCGLGYFLVIKPKLNSIDRAKSQEEKLLQDFKIKDSKLRNLKKNQSQLQQMEANFNQQLLQLPKETEIPSLVEDIHSTGVKSNLKFKNIQLENEVRQEFFIEQPISISATGDYHSFGNFVSGIAALPRIVTLHDFTITGVTPQSTRSDIPVVDYVLKAKTYRYVAGSEQNTPAAKGGKK